MGGKSSSMTVGYKYYAGFQMVLAKYIHRILRIRVDKKDAWVGIQTGYGSIAVNKPDLFGALDSSDPEGGVVATIDFEPGLPTQGRNAYLQSKLGTEIPAFRGVSCIVCEQGYLGNNPYMKQWDVIGQRIHEQDDGVAQWYDEKSEISVSDVSGSAIAVDAMWDFQVGPQQSNPGYENLVPPSSGYTSQQAPFGHGTTVGGGDQNTDWPLYDTLWIKRSIDLPAGQYLKLTIRAENGCVVILDGQVITWVNRDNLQPPPSYDGFVTLGPFPADKTAVLAIKGFDEAGAGSTDTYMSVVGEFYHSGDMNPAHIIRECLTNKEWGYGYDTDDLDDTSFRAAADVFYNESLGLSYFWDDDNTDIGDVIEKVLDHADAQLYVDRQTQLWKLLPVRGGYDQDTLPEFTLGEEIISMDSFSRPAFMELVNHVTVKYYNIASADTASITMPNPALYLQQGVKLEQTNTYDMCCSSGLGSRLAQRDINVLSNPLATGTVYLLPTDETELLHRGSVCKLTYPKYSLNQTIVRVTAISFGDGKTKRIKMSFVEDQFSLPDNPVTTAPPVGWTDPTADPTAIAHQLAIEVPYAYLLRSQGQSQLDSALASDPGLGYLGVAAARNPGAYSAQLYVDRGSGFEASTTVDFGPFGLLDGDIGFLDSTLTISDAEDLGELVAGTVFQIGDEIMSFTGISGPTLTGVKRGLFDTVPTKHVSGDPVFFWDGYLDSDETDYEDSESVDIRLLTRAANGQLDLSYAPTSTVTMASRAISPYPPGQVKIGGTAYPASASGTFTVTWKHRNRVTQADTQVDTTAGDVTPPPNTRYTLRFLDATSALIIERESIGPGTASVVLNYTGDVTMELFTVNEDGASIQRHSITFAYTPPGGTVVSAITATDYTPVDNTPIIDGGSA